MGKRELVLTELFELCQTRNDFVFDNDTVKVISRKYGFGNPFDATKIDNERKLPKILKDNDYAIIHLGKGKHQFIKGIHKVYHHFEAIDTVIDWKYQKSLLNLYNSSESNILSVANNQRILHHFLFGQDTELDDIEIFRRPKTYFPHRTKTSFNYRIENLEVKLEKIQIEIDLTIELQGTVGIFEAKNGIPDSFAIYQIYHPFLYYYQAKQMDSFIQNNMENIICVYLVRNVIKEINHLHLWAYTFDNPLNMSSIKCLKSATYKLIQNEI